MPTLRVLGEANTAQAQKQFAALTAQVEMLNKEMARTALIPSGGTPAGYTKTTAALGAAGRAYNTALAASGAFRVETLKVNDVIAQQTDLLRRQKLGYRDIWGSKAARQRMAMIRKEQIAMRNMTLRAVEGGIGDGHLRASLAIPKDVSKSWDTFRSKVGMVRYELASASRVMLNWGKNTQWAGRQLMAGITYPMAAFGAAAGVMAYQVDKQLTRVRKVYNTTSDQFSKNTEEQKAAMAELAQVSIDGLSTASAAARQYGASITETLGVQAELAATGQKGSKLQAATTEVMKSAMLGEIDYQTATKATIALQQTLNLSSQELADTWSYMNSVENQTSLSMADFATAIPIALGPLKQMGGTVQDLGTLLTAMVSRGVAVGKAANAIKASAQRLLRPSKQVREEFQAITGADIGEIAARNKGNVLNMMKELYDVTKDLSTYDKSKAFAGLFGSYQLATMSAMVDGMGDLEQGIGQTTTAYKVGTQSAEEWGKVQRQEIEAFQKSASGQFKIALETLKVSLASVGKPFLEVASVFLKTTTAVLDFFNSLPSGVKKVLIFVGILAALAGPALMLVGLMANLIANVGLFASFLLKLVANFELLNKAEWAQAKLDALYEKQLYSTTSAIELQTRELKALTLAMEAHNAEMVRSGGISSKVSLGMPAMPQAKPNLAGQQALMAGMYNPSTRRYHDPVSGNMIKQVEAERRAAAAYAEQIAASQGVQTRAAAENLRIQEKTSGVVKGQNVAMGAMAASMLLMTTNSNETAHNMGELLMILSLGVPLMKGMVLASGAVAAKGLAAAKAANAARVATAANYGQATLLTRTLGKTGAAARGLGASMTAMMGPVGWITAAVAAAAFTTYKIWQHNKEITKEKREQANAMYDQNNLLQDQLKITEQQKKELDITGLGYTAAGLPNAGDLAAEMQKSDIYKPLIDNLKSDDVMEVEKRATALAKYRDVLQSTGGTAQKATLYLEAMFRAAGDGALEAQQKAIDYSSELGSDFGASDMTKLWSDQMQSIFNDTDLKSIQEQGKNLGKDLANSIADGGRENAQKNLSNFVSIYEDQLPKEFDKLSAESRDLLGKLGVDAQNVGDIINKWLSRKPGAQASVLGDLGLKEGTQQAVEFQQVMMGLTEPGSAFVKLDNMQLGIVDELRNQLGIEQEINSFKELQATWEWKLATATAANSVEIAKQRIAYLNSINPAQTLFGINSDISDDLKIRLVNQVRLNAGQSELKSIYQVNAFLAGNLTDETEKNVTAVQKLKNAWDAVSFGGDDIKNIVKSGMEGVTNDLADAASEVFDNRMTASIEAAQTGWDKRIDDMNTRHENAMKAFDNRWDRRKDKVTAAYDAQIKGIDTAIKREEDAEKIRQKIFDAEMTRIERMKNIVNAGIDYNMALRTGNIDEAAKLQNDMVAQAQEWALGDAANVGADKSQNKIDALGASKDQLEEAKNKRIKAMEAVEEKQRDHLQKMQDQEEKSLQERSKNAMDALNDQWNFEKKNYNDKLDLFKSYTAMNKKDLDRWLAEVGLSYDDFGGATMLKGETWAGAIEKSLKKHVRAAGMDIANSQLWEAMGAKEAKATLMGMGFRGMGQFKKFIQTGELPSGFGKKRDQTVGINPAANKPHLIPGETLHSGGMVGQGINNRSGVARTTGLHNSEVMVRAQKGEFMVNRRVAEKNPQVLDYLNKHGVLPGGETSIYRHANLEGLGSGVPGVAGLTGMLARGVASSFANAFGNAGRAAVASAVNAVKARSGAPTTPYTGTIGEPNAIGAQAISWAADQIGLQGWYQLCQKFVRTALGAGGGFASAEDAWYGAKYRHSIQDTKKVPPGVPIYWTDGGNGHAALSTGGGNVISTDYPNSGIVGTGTIAGITSAWHKNLAGWTEDINGKRVFTGLRGGGYTTKDTPAVVHQGEMTIDAKRTKKMYGLVDNFTGLDGFWNWMSGSTPLGPNGMPMAPTGIPNKKGSSGTDNVRTGTYNVEFNTSNDQTQADLSKLMGLTDILALTEWSESKRALNKWVESKGWGILDPGPARNDSAVAWNKSKWTLGGQAVQQMNSLMGVNLAGGLGGGGAGAMYATGALLKSRTGKMSLWQIAAHTIAHLWKAAQNRKVQAQQFGALGSMANNLGKGGTVPVFVGGDLNNDPRAIGGGHGAQGSKWFAPLVAAGLKDNWNQGNMKGDFTRDNRYIDHMFSNGLAKAISQRVVGGMNSDHNALLTEFSIPQLRKGAQNIRWDNTLANLHKGESVLTQDLTSKFRDGVDNFANGGETQYTTNVYVNGSNSTPEEIARAVEKVHRRHQNRLPRKVSNR